MPRNDTDIQNFQELEQLEEELKRVRYARRYHTALRGTFASLAVVAALAVLASFLWLPVMRVTGGSMSPTLEAGQIVVALKGSDVAPGDVVGLYLGSRVLIKRVIAGPGDTVDIDTDGTVYVNDKALEEPYVQDKALGECDIELPYKVPENRWFVLSDSRAASADSRNTAVGSVAEEQLLGRVVLRVWPLSEAGAVK